MPLTVVATAAFAGDHSVETLRAKAEHGDAEAQASLGLDYDGGWGVSQDAVKARFWYSKAAQQGSATAQFELGKIYEEGKGVPKDVGAAVVWYRKAAAQGSGIARSYLRKLYFEGAFVPLADDHADVWWAKFAEQAKGESQTFSQTQRDAERDNTDAQVKLGVLYLMGIGTRKDRETAATWFDRAGRRGHANGECLFSALRAADAAWWTFGVADTGAFDRCLKAGNEGYAEAQMVLAVYYGRGRGVIKNESESVAWWRKAAKQGRADAQCMLAGAYHSGRGVPKDEKESLAWYAKAAEQQNECGLMQLSGMLAIATLQHKPLAIPSSSLSIGIISEQAIEHTPDFKRDFLPNLWRTQ